MCIKKHLSIKLLVLSVCFIGYVIFLYNYKIVRVDGVSMEPTLRNNQIVVIKMHKNIEDNDIMVFKREGNYCIKRVLGVANDEILLETNAMKINGFLQKNYNYKGKNQEYHLMEGQFFVIGDNNYNSLDSRVYGPVNEEDVLGEVVLKL